MNKFYKVKLRKLDDKKLISNGLFSDIGLCLKKKEIIVTRTLFGAEDIVTGEVYPIYKGITLNSLFNPFILKKDFASKNIATCEDISKYIINHYDIKEKLKLKVRK